jgi:hypothetical protein
MRGEPVGGDKRIVGGGHFRLDPWLVSVALRGLRFATAPQGDGNGKTSS